MPRLSLALVVLGAVYALGRVALSLVVPLSLTGVFQLRGAFGEPGGPNPEELPWLQAEALAGTAVSLGMSGALVAGLVAAWRGSRLAWRGLVGWWCVALAESLLRAGGIVALLAAKAPALALVVGLSSVDDVCCGLPTSWVWLFALGVGLVLARPRPSLSSGA